MVELRTATPIVVFCMALASCGNDQPVAVPSTGDHVARHLLLVESRSEPFDVARLLA